MQQATINCMLKAKLEDLNFLFDIDCINIWNLTSQDNNLYSYVIKPVLKNILKKNV